MTLRSAKARARGTAFEIRAALWLIVKGYRIIARNYRCHGGEIDLVALSPGRWIGRPELCFVEVRGRNSIEDAIESVGALKRQRLRRAASQFLAHHHALRGLSARFDLIAAQANGSMRHFHNAFEADRPPFTNR